MSTLVLCSKHRIARSVFQGALHLPSPVNGGSKLTLWYADIPNTVYTFNGDVFTFEEGGGGAKSIALTGAYTGVALAAYLSTWMTANSTAGDTYTVIYNTTTGKFEFSNAVPTAHSLTIATANLGERMGFAVGVDALANTHTSTFVCNLSPPKLCLFRFHDLQQATEIQHSTAGLLGHFVVPMISDSFGHVDYFANSEFPNSVKLAPNESLSLINYSLYEPVGRTLLALQNDWQIVLKVE
jgi:hypothetical protein